MRKFLLAFAVCLCSAMAAETVVLDLSKEASVQYDTEGVWTDVYKNSMVFTSNFMFSHTGASASYSYFSGFVPSKVSTNKESGSYEDQFGCMAKGGYVGEGTPFLVAHWDSYNETESNKTCMIYCLYSWYASGLYICNSPYAYFSMQKRDDFSKKFEQGDWLKLNIHAKDQFNKELDTIIEVYLADYRSENTAEWTMNNSWEWVDLSAFGKVSAIYFTMESSDTGQFGMNTPAYFCIDRLTLSSESLAAIDEVEMQVNAYYNRVADQLCVVAEQPVEVILYALNGTELLRAVAEGTATWDMSGYPAGVYVVRCGNQTIKVVK